jgi:hypothetical protein
MLPFCHLDSYPAPPGASGVPGKAAILARWLLANG